MRSWLVTVSIGIITMVLWGALVVAGTLDGWWRPSLAPTGDADAFAAAAVDFIDAHHAGNVAFALLEGGDTHTSHFVSIGEPVDADTLFQVASLSKWISAWGVMALVDRELVDLDAPINDYLTRWQLPAGDFDNGDVTVRRLLSHTAGLTDGLGYGGFVPGAAAQSLEDSLTAAVDASPGADGRVRVGIQPGSEFLYSGGGYTLLQLLIEEVSGQPFETFMRTTVFDPLAMTRSTYVVTSSLPNQATLYDVDGTPATRYHFSGQAPTALNTSVRDMIRFVTAHLPDHEPQAPLVPGRDVLQPETLQLMRQPHASQLGMDIWGLGTILYAPTPDGDFVFGHDGSNEPAINSAVRINPATGDAIVILETGNRLLATTLAGEWVFWQAGAIDLLSLTMKTDAMLRNVLVGWLIIVAGALILGWRFSRNRRVTAPGPGTES